MAELAHITRRKMLKGLAVGSAVSVPSVAIASPDERIAECLLTLKTLLKEAYPDAKIGASRWDREDSRDFGYCFLIQPGAAL